MRLLAMFALLACRCGAAPAPAPGPGPGPAPEVGAEVAPAAGVGHYEDFDALVDAAAKGDRTAAVVATAGLTGGTPCCGEKGEDAASEVGSAIGFVATAEDGEELADGVATAAEACGTCHAEAKATPPPRPPWDHPHAAKWAVWGLVWNDDAAPAEGGEAPLDAIAAKWKEPVPKPEDSDEIVHPARERVIRALVQCQGCHSKK